VTSPSGKIVSPDMTKVVQPFSGMIHALNQGQVVEITFNVSKLITLDVVGTYKIIAKKKMWSDAKHEEFEVVSNPLEVVVISNQ
jgi:hypothetical protein